MTDQRLPEARTVASLPSRMLGALSLWLRWMFANGLSLVMIFIVGLMIGLVFHAGLECQRRDAESTPNRIIECTTILIHLIADDPRSHAFADDLMDVMACAIAAERRP